MKVFEMHWGLMSLLCMVALSRADPTPAIYNSSPNRDTGIKRLFSLFNWGNSESRPNNVPQGPQGVAPFGQGPSPCFPITTTTPQPLPLGPIPLCPLQPMPRPDPPIPPPRPIFTTPPPLPPPTPRPFTPEPLPCGPQPNPNCVFPPFPPNPPPVTARPGPPIWPVRPLVPVPIDPIPVPTINTVDKYCAGVPPGPFIPPSFFLADSFLQQQHCRDKCRAPPMEVPPCTMLEVLQQLRLRTIFSLIQQAGLEPLFLQTSRYTLFAPVDSAFEKLPGWFMQSLRDDIKLLRAFILNHFVKDKVSLSNIGHEYRVLNARSGGHRVRINVYHQKSDYRVYTVDGARILLGEIPTTNDGVLHLLDKVLVPNPPRLISEYLTEMPELKLFMNAVMQSGLLPLFQDNDTPITLFVPYNHAFKHFDYDSIAGNQVAIQNFVQYHMLNGTLFSPGALHGQYATTNYYKEIKLSVSTDGFTKYLDMVNGRIKILKSDIPMRNGVVHVVDTCFIDNLEFLVNSESYEFGSDYGVFKRSMTLNKKELEKGF